MTATLAQVSVLLADKVSRQFAICVAIFQSMFVILL